MPYKDINEQKEYNKKTWKSRSPEWRREHYQKYKNFYKIKSKVWREAHKEERASNMKAWLSKNQASWIGVVPEETKCQICGKIIYFNKGKIDDAIHFDHKTNHDILGRTPTGWLSQFPRTPERETIWRSCNFGMLCRRCNRLLPTKNRDKVLNYLQGIPNV